MCKKIIILATIIAIGGMSAMAWAGESKRFDEGTQTCRHFSFPGLAEGYKTFRNICKNCHNRQNEVGAPFLHTESKTNLAWNRVFFEKYPTCATDGSWDSLSLDDRLKLNDYLFLKAHGHDDPNDASCA